MSSIIEKIRKKSEVLEQHRLEGTFSSAGMFKSFMDDTVYADFLNEVDVQLEDALGGLEDPKGLLAGRDYDLLRGVILALRNTREIFTLMHENALTDQENREKNNDS